MALHPHLTRPAHELAGELRAATTARDVARILEIEYHQFTYILYRGSHQYQYSTLAIPKKSGGTRELRIPHPSVKLLQSKLAGVLQEIYSPPRGVHGYVPRRSIVTNARRHEGKQWVLTVDFKAFFPSINFGRVRGLFLKQYYLAPPVATVLARLCTTENELPQGAPTSPVVSNMLCARMDRELHQLARLHECWFTRYADDITISTRHRDFPAELARVTYKDNRRTVMVGAELDELIRSNGFSVNVDKVWLKSRDRRQIVTGLIVNNGVNVPRRFIRRVRAMMHNWETDPRDAERVFALGDRRRTYRGAEPPAYLDVVRGMIEYVGMVKGKDDSVYIMLMEKLERISPT